MTTRQSARGCLGYRLRSISRTNESRDAIDDACERTPRQLPLYHEVRKIGLRANMTSSSTGLRIPIPDGRLIPYTVLVHNGVMKVAEKAVRQSVSLPPRVAKQVGSMAKSRKLSKNRMLLELIENGIDAEKRKQQQFFALAERFRNEQDPEAANRLGDELGRMVFGG